MALYYPVDIASRSDRGFFKRARNFRLGLDAPPPFVYHFDEYLSRGISDRVSLVIQITSAAVYIVLLVAIIQRTSRIVARF